MCGLSRLVFPSAMVGLAVATMAGSAAAGWLAAAVVAGLLYLLGRRQLGGACRIAPRDGRPFGGLTALDPAETAEADRELTRS